MAARWCVFGGVSGHEQVRRGEQHPDGRRTAIHLEITPILEDLRAVLAREHSGEGIQLLLGEHARARPARRRAAEEGGLRSRRSGRCGRRSNGNSGRGGFLRQVAIDGANNGFLEVLRGRSLKRRRPEDRRSGAPGAVALARSVLLLLACHDVVDRANVAGEHVLGVGLIQLGRLNIVQLLAKPLYGQVECEERVEAGTFTGCGQADTPQAQIVLVGSTPSLPFARHVQSVVADLVVGVGVFGSRGRFGLRGFGCNASVSCSLEVPTERCSPSALPTRPFEAFGDAFGAFGGGGGAALALPLPLGGAFVGGPFRGGDTVRAGRPRLTPFA
jgi:hypothetical protein